MRCLSSYGVRKVEGLGVGASCEVDGGWSREMEG